MIVQRRRARSRFVVLTVVAVTTAVGAGRARAQITPTPTFTKADFNIRLQRLDGTEYVNLSTNESLVYFNAARCNCKTDVRVIAELTAAGSAKSASLTMGSLKLYVGSNCLDVSNTTERDKRCEQLGAATQLTAFAHQSITVPVTADVLVTPNNHTCDPKRIEQTISLFVDFESDGIPDLADAPPVLTFTVDTQPPPEPTVTSVQGGNEALLVSWTAIATTDVMDIDGYQVFCSRGGDLPVFKTGTFSTNYQTAATLCPTTPAALPPGTMAIGAPDAAVPYGAFGGIKDLDPAYLCSSQLPSTQTSTRVRILQNDIPYLVGLAAVDKHGNASSISTVYLQSPVPSKDFYKGYRDGSGQSKGGFCALEPGGGPRSAGFFSVMAAAAAALLLRWRRRR